MNTYDERTPRSRRKGDNSERRDLMKSNRNQGYSTNDEEREDRRSHRQRSKDKRKSKSRDKDYDERYRNKEDRHRRKP